MKCVVGFFICKIGVCVCVCDSAVQIFCTYTYLTVLIFQTYSHMRRNSLFYNFCIQAGKVIGTNP